MRGPILERQSFVVNQQLLKQGKEDLYKAIQNLSDKKKDFICDCIIQLAKFDFQRHFIEWFIEYRLDKTTEQGEIKEKELRQNVKRSKAMSKLLVEWISVNRVYGKMHICSSSKRTRILIDENSINYQTENPEINLNQQLKEQLKHKKEIRKTEKRLEQANEEKIHKDIEDKIK